MKGNSTRVTLTCKQLQMFQLEYIHLDFVKTPLKHRHDEMMEAFTCKYSFIVIGLKNILTVRLRQPLKKFAYMYFRKVYCLLANQKNRKPAG